MRCSYKILISLSLIIFAVLILSSTAYAEREFRIPNDVVADFTGTFSQSDLDEIRGKIQGAFETNSMDGHVIITLRTEEWYLDEYVKDYADFLQGRGLIKPTGWLLYVSIADRKFALHAQNAAKDTITLPRKIEIELRMNEKFSNGDIKGAILVAVDSIAKLKSPSSVAQERKMPPDMLVFFGIAIIVAAIMMRMRLARKKG